MPAMVITANMMPVSVHFRLGGAEPADVHFASVAEWRGFPSPAWYRLVLTRVLNPTRAVFLLFSDNTSKLDVRALHRSNTPD